MSRPLRIGGTLVGVLALLATAAPALAAPTAPEPAAEAAPDVVEGRVLVTWERGASAAERERVRRTHGLVTQDVVAGLGLEALRVPATAPADVVARIGADPAVAIAEPDYVLEASTTVDDPGFEHQWGLHNTGADGGVADVDVDAPEAWEDSTGRDVVVAVIDTGMDIQHPDLADNIWTNPGEIPGNGVDDDENGYVDDVHGWDFLDDDPNVRESPTDDQHATHVAGTIAAVADNGIGVAGVAPDVTIMPLRFLGTETGTGSTLDAVRAVDYAASNGARVINASWGGDEGGETLRNAIAWASGSAFVAAVGNKGVDIDQERHYPAEWARDTHGIGNILSVTAVDRTGALPGYANYGDQVVDVGAPGSEILSTTPNGTYRRSSGTSMAAPHAAGVAALAASLGPALSGTELVDLVKAEAQPLDSLASRTTTGGLVNAAGTAALVASSSPEGGSASDTLAAGETLSTDTAGDGATADEPLETAVTVSEAGRVDITATNPTFSAPDWSFLGVQVAVAAPSGTADDPLVIRFHLDGSLDADGVVVFRGGEPVAECPGATTARPDPCVTGRTTDGDDTVLTVLASQGGSWGFARPTVACPPSRVPESGFDDLAGGVHDPAIACMAWWEVANGLTADRFGPGQVVTRAQMASFVARAIRVGGGELPAGSDHFTDDDGSIHEADIDALAAAGIVQGTGDGRYAPNRPVSRAEMATFLVRADGHLLDVSAEPIGDHFVDDDASVHEDAINRAYEAELVRGTSADTYAPNRSVIRAEMATFLSRLLDRAVGAGVAHTPI